MSQPNLTNQFTPRGRFVSGDLHTKQVTDYENKPVPPEDQEYYFAVAVPKTSPQVAESLGALHGYASQSYQANPSVMQQIGMGLNATGFSWKVEDGDTPKKDRKTGQLKEIPEYIKGCYIFKFATKYEFGACDATGNEIDPSRIKRGDYVDVMYTVTPNGRVDGNAGLKLYPNAVRFLDLGEAISARVDAATAFAGRSAESSGQAHPAAGQTFQTGQANAAMGMPQPMGNPLGGSPAPTGIPSAGQPAPAGGMTGAMGGMPAAQPGQATASPSDVGVQPHSTILRGPGGGMPGM